MSFYRPIRSKMDHGRLEAALKKLNEVVNQGSIEKDTNDRIVELSERLKASDWESSVENGIVRKRINGFELQVIESSRGFYIGVSPREGKLVRESDEYWHDEGQARFALNSGDWRRCSFELSHEY